MGGVIKILGTGLKWLVALAGGAIWLGGVGLLAFSLWRDRAAGGDPAAMLHAALAIGGLLIALVFSVIMLRLSARITPFLICVVFGAVAFAGGAMDDVAKVAGAPAAQVSVNDESGAAAAPDVAVPPPSDTKTASSMPAPTDSPAPPMAQPIPAAEPPPPPPPPPGAESAFPKDSPAPGGSGAGHLAGQKRSVDRSIDEERASPTDAVHAEEQEHSSPATATPDSGQFHLAELRFNKPAEMRLERPYVVEATIASPGAAAPEGLGNVGPTVTRQTEITRKVRVELISNDFKIEKLHTVDTVLITPQTPGQWSWRVTPLHEGADRKMLLQVFGVLEQGGVAQGEVMIKTYAETIPVTVTPIDRAQQIAGLVISSWQTVAGIAGVIGGVWVFFGNVGRALSGRRETAPA